MTDGNERERKVEMSAVSFLRHAVVNIFITNESNV